MRLPRSTADAAILSTLLFPFFSGATNFDCGRIQVDKVGFDLSELGGPQSVMHPSEEYNTTYTIDVCRPLKKPKNVPAKVACPNGTRVCAVKRMVKDGTEIIDTFTPIAGELSGQGGKDMDAKFERLKTSTSHSDSQKEGLRVELNGGYKEKRKQKAIVEFICDKERNGLENLYDPEYKYSDKKVKREEQDTPKEKPKDDGPNSASLRFFSYDEGEGDTDILRLEWRTKHACEDSKSEQDAEKAGHWGFFTWFIIIGFLSTATYLIFGSWLNYNRYGARGWDLLPHGDTIRDVPYLFKDWMRRVLNTIQGGGSRGGYAAV